METCEAEVVDRNKPSSLESESRVLLSWPSREICDSENERSIRIQDYCHPSWFRPSHGAVHGIQHQENNTLLDWLEMLEIAR